MTAAPLAVGATLLLAVASAAVTGPAYAVALPLAGIGVALAALFAAVNRPGRPDRRR